MFVINIHPPIRRVFSLLTVQSPLLNWKNDRGRRRPTHARECLSGKFLGELHKVAFDLQPHPTPQRPISVYVLFYYERSHNGNQEERLNKNYGNALAGGKPPPLCHAHIFCLPDSILFYRKEKYFGYVMSEIIFLGKLRSYVKPPLSVCERWGLTHPG